MAVEDYLDLMVRGGAAATTRIAVAVPLSGVLGLTGPAGLAAARLALEQERARGDGARGVTLVPVDAGSTAASSVVRALVDEGAVSAVVGFHSSDVFEALQRVIDSRVPYVYTPPHEGDPIAPCVFRTGPSPEDQLRPVVRAFASRRALRRWALVGDDYVWPRRVRACARRALREAGADVVLDVLCPVGRCDPGRLLDALRSSRAQAILVSLVGRDLVRFNRAFAASGLGGRLVRVSGSLEECGLVDAGGDDSGELYSTMGWFASDPQSAPLLEQFSDRWGPDAPTLGSYAAGLYPAVRTLAGLAYRGALDAVHVARAAGSTRPVTRIARAEGLRLVAAR